MQTLSEYDAQGQGVRIDRTLDADEVHKAANLNRADGNADVASRTMRAESRPDAQY